ncbi:MFS transporter [Paraburkholderia sp. HD33-4]|uniref:MFS transporter n=1 Tax=Paraburkholderia sp. HD33-4 TaxID=2883242 RepID=UPI001F4520C5|nr:MFS transporter [Paraburkholderia sp. HD33-4]
MSIDQRKQQAASLLVIIGSYLMIVLDTSIVIAGLPHIRADLGLTPAQLSSVQSVYTLFFGAFLLFGARCGDLAGARRIMQVGLSVFIVSSAAIGMAHDSLWLIVARAIQGIGASLIAPSALTLLSQNFEEGEARNSALAWYGSTAGIGASVGLVLGGVFAETLSWRAGFFLNIPVGIALLYITRRSLNESPRFPTRLDTWGALLSTFGFSSIILAVMRTEVEGWLSRGVLLPAAIGVVTIVAFLWHEHRTSQPLMPMRVFAHRRRLGAYIIRFLFLGPMVSFFFFGSQFMQDALGFSAIEAGLGFLPMTVVAFVAPFSVPVLARRMGEDAVLLLGLLSTCVGILWMSFLDTSATFWMSIALPMSLIGAGQGLSLAPMTSAGVSGVAKSETGVASGVLNVAHQLGASLGLGLLTSVAVWAQRGIADHQTALVHSTRAVFIVGGAMLIAAMVAVVVFLRPSGNHKPCLKVTEYQ